MLYLIIGTIVIHNIKLQFELNTMKTVVRAMIEIISNEDND